MLARTLTSLQHPIVKYLVKLRQDRSFRRMEQKILVSGFKLVQELVEQRIPVEILLSADPHQKISMAVSQSYVISEAILKKITGLEHPEPLAAVVPMPSFQDVSVAQRLLVLDGISDPGNLGTLIRSALALGWDGIFIVAPSCDPFNEKAIRSAKGATFRLPIQEGSWEQFILLSKQKPFHVYLADKQGSSLESMKPSLPMALILSRESQGARQEAKAAFTSITIPMQERMESLNVASAGAILLYCLKERT
jgi:RNA methyltransferase, TrmH family